MPNYNVYNISKFIFHRFDLLRIHTELFVLKPTSKFAQAFKTHLSYDNALKNIKQIYPWNENDFSVLKGGNETIKPLLSNTIDVSFVVPCYNAEKYLERCAKSLVNQRTDVSYEIIFINDGSTDNTQKILEDFKEKYGEKVRVIEQKNQGSAAARNTGIENANGEYIAFVDSDDFIEHLYLETLWNKKNQTDADLIQCAFKKVDEKGKEFSVVQNQTEALIENNYERVSKVCFGFVWSGIWKKSVFSTIRFPYGFWYEDMILIFPLIQLLKNYCCVNEAIYNYTIRNDSISHAKGIKSLDQLLLPLLIVKYSKEVLKLQDDAFLYKRLLHEYSSMLYSRTKNVRGGEENPYLLSRQKS